VVNAQAAAPRGGIVIVWPWHRLEALEDLVAAQDARIVELEGFIADHDKQFAELRIRFSGPEAKMKEESPLVPDTDWLNRRKKLTEQFAVKGES
jgi:hypothetical protein